MEYRNFLIYLHNPNAICSKAADIGRIASSCPDEWLPVINVVGFGLLKNEKGGGPLRMHKDPFVYLGGHSIDNRKHYPICETPGRIGGCVVTRQKKHPTNHVPIFNYEKSLKKLNSLPFEIFHETKRWYLTFELFVLFKNTFLKYFCDFSQFWNQTLKMCDGGLNHNWFIL